MLAIWMRDTETLSNSEVEVIRRCQAGDRASFDLLVRDHYQLAYNIAYRMLADANSAADATQNAFVRAFRALDDFRADASFATWLYRIVTNVCLDHIRQAQKEPTNLTVLADDETTRAQRDIPDERADPAAQVEQQQRQQVVHAALQRMSPEHRGVVVLYDLNGFSHEETAQILDIPTGTVKSRLNRARLILKELLHEHWELFA